MYIAIYYMYKLVDTVNVIFHAHSRHHCPTHTRSNLAQHHATWQVSSLPCLALDQKVWTRFHSVKILPTKKREISKRSILNICLIVYVSQWLHICMAAFIGMYVFNPSHIICNTRVGRELSFFIFYLCFIISLLKHPVLPKKFCFKWATYQNT